MNAFEIFQKFLALKRHFSPGSKFNFHKYGKTSATYKSFEERSDRFVFEKLAKLRDPMPILIANVSADHRLFSHDLIEDRAQERTREFLKKTEAITYHINKEFSQFDQDFDSLFIFKNGSHPPIIGSLQRGEVSIEVLAVVDEIINFTSHWEKYSWDPVAATFTHKIRKLRGFIQYDASKVKDAIRKLFSRRDIPEPERV